jgi:glutamate synthase (NADPH/NADH) small chain
MGNVFQFIDVQRQDPKKVPAKIRVAEYKEIYGQFDAQAAAVQADRCLSCGNP